MNAKIRRAVDQVSDSEAQWIADTMVKILEELQRGKRVHDRLFQLESTGTGYLPPDVKTFVLKASAA